MVGIAMVCRSVFDGHAWANKNFAEQQGMFLIQFCAHGKRHAIGWRWVIEKLCMGFGNGLLVEKVEVDFPGWSVRYEKKIGDELDHLLCINGKIGLLVVKMNNRACRQIRNAYRRNVTARSLWEV